ncbi:MAG TPA: YbaB/EbfC family nucleoid-associated protein [Nocardioidaceae bacterium]|nr:YbaB/EbfC family nucleoid-associated protein [Nocardioidaceae bacterium]
MFPTGDNSSSEGGPDLGALLQQAQQMQEQLMATQAQLAEERVEGSAGNGLIKATVTGTGDLVSLDISPEACDPDDTETLSDLVVAAIHDATAESQKVATERLGPLAGFAGEDAPGLGELGGGPGGAGGPGGKLGF